MPYARPKKRCPKCGADEFIVTAHVTQTWRVDADGNFLNCVSECEEVTHKPDDADLWNCTACGHSAAGRDFNVPADETAASAVTGAAPAREGGPGE